MSLGSFVSGYVPMLRLGDFNFSINVAVFQELHRVSEFKWAAQDRFGQSPARQFVGLGDDSITLPGVIYPEWRGSSNAMAQLRSMASQGLPYLMLDAQGHIYGRWVIESIEETRSIFAAFAQPKKIEFVVSLKLFDGGDNSLLPDLSGTMLGTIISAGSSALQNL
jgi:phage protein U